MKIAACYIRVSTDDQLEFSPDAQLRAMKKYCDDNDLLLPKEFIFMDEGISGRNAKKRPAFQNMIKTAKTKPKPFDIILVHKFDRFARNREDSVVYKSLLRSELGIQVVSITESIGDDKMGIIMESMLEAMAEYYSLNLSDEVKKGMSEKAKKGGVQTKPSFGYKVENNKFIPDEIEAPYVTEIFKRFVSGEPYSGIARWLNSVGMRTHQGNKFEQRTVQYIIGNPVYIGTLRWTPSGRTERNKPLPDTIFLENQHTPLVAKELWDIAQKKRRKLLSAQRKYVKEGEHKSFWLSGLLVCDNCGRTLSRSGKYLQCCGYSKSICNISHSISLAHAEELVIERLKSDYNNITQISISNTIKTPTKKDETKLYRDAIERLEKSLARAKEAYISGIDSLEEYGENKRRIQEELDKNKKYLENLSQTKPGNKRTLSKNIKSTLDFIQDKNNSIDDKNKALKQIVSKIIFVKATKSLEIIYY